MDCRASRRGFLLGVSGFASTSVTAGVVDRPGLPASGGLARVQGRLIAPRKVLLWESTRKEIREAIEGGRLKAAIVPTGSTEQHNEHLAMIQDTASAVLVGQQAALQLWPQVTVATPVAVGISPYWMERPGTLTLRPETFLAMVYDICDSLRQHGLKTIFIVNGHGGNAKPLKDHMAEFRSKLGVNIDACSYWDAFAEAANREEAQEYMETGVENIPGHSAEFETSFALAAFPERVHRDGVDYEKLRMKFKDRKDAGDDRRYYLESLKACAEKGEALIRITVDWLADRLRRMIAAS